MVFSTKFGLRPVAPAGLNKLYQGIIAADGKWKTPSGPTIELYPTWKSEFQAPNIYRITYDIGSRAVSIQIDMLNPLYKHSITAIDETGFTVETRDADGNPAPCEWKFKLRKTH